MGLFCLGPHLCLIFGGEVGMLSCVEVWRWDGSPCKEFIPFLSSFLAYDFLHFCFGKAITTSLLNVVLLEDENSKGIKNRKNSVFRAILLSPALLPPPQLRALFILLIVTFLPKFVSKLRKFFRILSEDHFHICLPCITFIFWNLSLVLLWQLELIAENLMQRTKDLDTAELLEQLPALQQLLFRVLGCQVIYIVQSVQDKGLATWKLFGPTTCQL